MTSVVAVEVVSSVQNIITYIQIDLIERFLLLSLCGIEIGVVCVKHDVPIEITTKLSRGNIGLGCTFWPFFCRLCEVNFEKKKSMNVLNQACKTRIPLRETF